MNICHVNLATGFSGGERQTLELIKQQIREGYTLTVVANPQSPFAKEIEQLDCKLILASHFTKQHSVSVTKDIALVHVHEGRAIYWALLQKLFHSVPYIVTRRIDNKLKNKFLSKLAYNKASALVGLSNEIVARIKERHPKANIHKIPSSPVSYPTDAKQVSAIREEFQNKFLVIHAAKLLKHKGIDVTVAAAKELKENPDIHFIVLGDGPEENSLKERAEGLTNITFAGRQSDMGNWFEAADLLIHPSYTEGLGSVILEAIKAGLPVVGAKAGGIPDIIDGKNSGLLINPGDHNALAKAVSEIQTAPELRQKLIEGGKKKLESFEISYTSQLYKDIYLAISGKGTA